MNRIKEVRIITKKYLTDRTNLWTIVKSNVTKIFGRITQKVAGGDIAHLAIHYDGKVYEMLTAGFKITSYKEWQSVNRSEFVEIEEFKLDLSQIDKKELSRILNKLSRKRATIKYDWLQIITATFKRFEKLNKNCSCFISYTRGDETLPTKYICSTFVSFCCLVGNIKLKYDWRTYRPDELVKELLNKELIKK